MQGAKILVLQRIKDSRIEIYIFFCEYFAFCAWMTGKLAGDQRVLCNGQFFGQISYGK